MNEQRFVSMYSDTYEAEVNLLAKNPDGAGYSWQFTQWLEKKLEESDKALLALQKAGLGEIGVEEEVTDDGSGEGMR